MSIRKKILATSIGPVLVLGVITLLFMLTMVKSSLMDEVQDALKGTAAATLAAYDQNTGDYLESTNGDIWKGSYNISKSESLVDRIKENTGMDVTFFYGNKRIMTSALDKKGNRILGSEAGERVVKQVIKGKKPFFSTNVSREIMDILFRCIRMERQIRLSVWCLSEPIRHKKMQLSIKSLEVL